MLSVGLYKDQLIARAILLLSGQIPILSAIAQVSSCVINTQKSSDHALNLLGAVCDSIFDETTGTISNATGPYLLGTRYNFTCNTNLLMWPENTQLTIYTCQYDVTWDQPFKACSRI